MGDAQEFESFALAYGDSELLGKSRAVNPFLSHPMRFPQNPKYADHTSSASE